MFRLQSLGPLLQELSNAACLVSSCSFRIFHAHYIYNDTLKATVLLPWSRCIGLAMPVIVCLYSQSAFIAHLIGFCLAIKAPSDEMGCLAHSCIKTSTLEPKCDQTDYLLCLKILYSKVMIFP